jgi:hypothetical protein
MPQRSNTFQRWALHVHKQLGEGWKIQESHMFVDLVTGDQREVDIVAQTVWGTYPIFLSIECRDHARPADVLWIEGVAKKHEHLPTSKLVLWSRSGFTKGAALKARALKIETVSQADALGADWARLARELIGGQVQHVIPSYTAFIDVLRPKENLVALSRSIAQIGTKVMVHKQAPCRLSWSSLLTTSKPARSFSTIQVPDRGISTLNWSRLSHGLLIYPKAARRRFNFRPEGAVIGPSNQFPHIGLNQWICPKFHTMISRLCAAQ